MENKVLSNLQTLKGISVYVLQSDKYGAIQGLSTVGDRLYVITDNCTQIDVYNTRDFTILEPIPIDIEDSCSLVACSQHNCLYLIDRRFNDVTSQSTYNILKLALSTLTIDKWQIQGIPMGLSMTKNGNLLVTAWDLNPNESEKLLEYSTHGELLRVINVTKEIECAYHSVELSPDVYSVCHTGVYQHRVCLIDGKGQILRSYGGSPGSNIGELNLPIHLAVFNDTILLVADRKNNRVQMLNSTLDYVGEVEIDEVQLHTPRRIHFDQQSSRLYITHRNKNKTVL